MKLNKTAFIISSLLSTLSLTASADCSSIGSSSGGGDPTKTTLQAQIEATCDQITQLKKQIGTQGDDKYTYEDYKAKMNDYALRVESHLIKFTDFLEHELLPEFNTEIIEYNSAYKENYDTEKKKEALADTYKAIQRKVTTMTPKYQKAIMDLYKGIAGEFPITAYKGDLATIDNQTYVIYSPLTDDLGIFTYYVLPYFEAGCKTRSCVLFSAIEYSRFISGIKKQVDKTLDVTLADGNKFSLAARNLDIAVTLKFLAMRDFPARVTNLPFGIQK